MINFNPEHVSVGLGTLKGKKPNIDEEDTPDDSDSDSESDECFEYEDEAAKLISSEEEAELEAQRISFQELIESLDHSRRRQPRKPTTPIKKIRFDLLNVKVEEEVSSSTKLKASSKRTSFFIYTEKFMVSDISCRASWNCANIHGFSEHNKLIFICIFCNLRYNDLEAFAKHLNHDHDLYQSDKEITCGTPFIKPKTFESRGNCKNGTEETLLTTHRSNLFGKIVILNYKSFYYHCANCIDKFCRLDSLYAHLATVHNLFSSAACNVLKNEATQHAQRPPVPSSNQEDCAPLSAPILQRPVQEPLPVKNENQRTEAVEIAKRTEFGNKKTHKSKPPIDKPEVTDKVATHQVDEFPTEKDTLLQSSCDEPTDECSSTVNTFPSTVNLNPTHDEKAREEKPAVTTLEPLPVHVQKRKRRGRKPKLVESSEQDSVVSLLPKKVSTRNIVSSAKGNTKRTITGDGSLRGKSSRKSPTAGTKSSCDDTDKSKNSESDQYDETPSTSKTASSRLKLPQTNQDKKITKSTSNAVLHECNQCKKTFKKLTRLKEHLRLHTGEKPFECKQCNKCFRIKNRLNDHLLRHNAEKSFRCDYCGMGVATKQDLALHMRHHVQDRRYKCTLCDKGFVRSSDLKIHKRIHTGEKPYMCEICGKTFRANQNLIIHRRSHTRDKTIKCEECGKEFIRKIDCKVHFRTHTGEKPYKCEICGRGYSSRVHVRNHLERDHIGNAKEETKKRGKPSRKQKNNDSISKAGSSRSSKSVDEAVEELLHDIVKIDDQSESPVANNDTNDDSIFISSSCVQKSEDSSSSPTPSSPMGNVSEVNMSQVSVTVSMQVENVDSMDERLTASSNQGNARGATLLSAAINHSFKDTIGHSQRQMSLKKEQKLADNFLNVIGKSTKH